MDGPSMIVTDSSWVVTGLDPSESTSTKVAVPAWVGVPDSWPVDGSRTSPSGTVPIAVHV